MLYKETVEPDTLDILIKLMGLSELQQFRLVGGTALSLFVGHRKSIDLGFFSDEPFDRDIILEALHNNFSNLTFANQRSNRLLFTTIENVKVDFVYTFERFSTELLTIENIRFASLAEIAALKLNAIAGRGAKKDFWDINTLLQSFSFEEMIEFYQQRYPNNSIMMPLKSITYFNDADVEIDPICLKGLNWETVKNNILEAFNKYINTR